MTYERNKHNLIIYNNRRDTLLACVSHIIVIDIILIIQYLLNLFFNIHEFSITIDFNFKKYFKTIISYNKIMTYKWCLCMDIMITDFNNAVAESKSFIIK